MPVKVKCLFIVCAPRRVASLVAALHRNGKKQATQHTQMSRKRKYLRIMAYTKTKKNGRRCAKESNGKELKLSDGGKSF